MKQRILTILTVMAIAAPAFAQPIDWFADMVVNPTDPAAVPTLGYWVIRGGPNPDPAWFTFQTVLPGSDSLIDNNDPRYAGGTDMAMLWGGTFNPVFDTQPQPENFAGDAIDLKVAAMNRDGSPFIWGFQPIGRHTFDGSTGSSLDTDLADGNASNEMFLNVDSATALVTMTNANFGGQGGGSLARHFQNRSALVDLEDKDGDGAIIEYVTGANQDMHWLPYATRDAGLELIDPNNPLATGDLIEVEFSIDTVTNHVANETYDAVDGPSTLDDGLENVEVNYMLVNYTIDSLADGDGTDVRTGQYGLGVTTWPNGNPAPFGIPFDGMADFLILDQDDGPDGPEPVVDPNSRDVAIAGDADREGDVDNSDILTAIGNFTGPEPSPGTFGKVWREGNFDGTVASGDTDVDSSDILIATGNFTGPGGGIPDVSPGVVGVGEADLIYDPGTGEVALDATDTPGGVLTGYVIQDAEGGLLPGGHTPILAGTTTSLATEISEANPFGGVNGSNSIGVILPIGMDLAQLTAMLDSATYTGELGSGVCSLELNVVEDQVEVIPEPATIALLGLAAIGLAARRKK